MVVNGVGEKTVSDTKLLVFFSLMETEERPHPGFLMRGMEVPC